MSTPLTRAQRKAVFALYCRDNPSAATNFAGFQRGYRRFRRQFRRYVGGYVGGPWKGMFVGIEPDGYTHT